MAMQRLLHYLFTILKAIFRIIWVILNNFYVIPAYLVWTLFLVPVRLYAPKTYQKIDGVLFKWTLAHVGCWMWTAGYTIAEAGEDISMCDEEESLVTVNHQSTADVPTLMFCLQHHGSVLNNAFWIIDYLFKYTNFGFISQCRGDFFIQQGKEVRHNQCSQLKDHLYKNYWPRDRKWLVIFPEGGFLYKRRAKNQEYARKYGFPVLDHVTLPRIGAMQIMMTHASPQGMKSLQQGVHNGLALKESSRKPLKWLVDITIGYPKGEALDLLTICAGYREPCEITIHYRHFPIEDIPLETDQLNKWMYDRFVEKEKLLDIFYKTGQFPVLSESETGDSVDLQVPRKVECSSLHFLLIHLFYLSSTILQYYLFSWIFCDVLQVF